MAAKKKKKSVAMKKKSPAKKKAAAKPKAKARAAKPKAAKPTKKRAQTKAAVSVALVATIVQEETFDAAPMDVYEALVDPAKHAQFTGSTATGEPVEGGAFTAWDGYIEGRHERLVPGAR